MRNFIIGILAFLSAIQVSVAAWDGFPWSQYKEWSETKPFNVYSQLVEGVQERCSVLSCRGVEPLMIYDTWTVQVGTVSNRAIYTNIETCNIMVSGQTKIDISGYYSIPGYKPPQTNNPQELTLYFPMKKEWIDAIDEKLFEITPYFVQTNLMRMSSYGTNTFDDYFWGYTDPAYLTYPMHCRASVMKNAGIGFTYGEQYQARRTGYVLTDGYAWFTRQPPKNNEKWTIWECGTKQYNVITVSGFSNNDYNGTYRECSQDDPFLDGWWYRDWWFAYRLSPDVSTVYMKEDKSYIISKRLSYNLYYIFPDWYPMYLWSFDKVSQTDFISMRKDVAECASIITNEFLSLNDDFWGCGYTYYFPYLTTGESVSSTNNSWRCIPDSNLDPGLSIWGNGVYIPCQDIHLGYFPAYYYVESGITNQLDSLDNYPPEQNASIIPSTNVFWSTGHSLVPFDKRYYNKDGYSYVTFNPSTLGTEVTNAIITVTLSGLGWRPPNDYYHEVNFDQGVSNISETVILNIPNTRNDTVKVNTSNKWYSVTSGIVSGLTTIGSSVTLGWTNWNTFANTSNNIPLRNPYNLYIQNLDERAKYMSQLTMTLGYNDTWETYSNYLYGYESELINSNTFHPVDYNDTGTWSKLKDTRELWGTEAVDFIPDPLVVMTITGEYAAVSTSEQPLSPRYNQPYVRREYRYYWQRLQDFIWRYPATLDLTALGNVILDPTPWYTYIDCGDGMPLVPGLGYGPYNSFYGQGWVGGTPAPEGGYGWWNSAYTQQRYDWYVGGYYNNYWYLYDYYDSYGTRRSGGFGYDVGSLNEYPFYLAYPDWSWEYQQWYIWFWWIQTYVEINHTPNWLKYYFGGERADFTEISSHRTKSPVCNTTIAHEVQFYAGAYTDLLAPEFSYIHNWDRSTNHIYEPNCFSKPWEFDLSKYTVYVTNANEYTTMLDITSNDASLSLVSKAATWSDPYPSFCTNLIERTPTTEVYSVTVVVTNCALIDEDSFFTDIAYSLQNGVWVEVFARYDYLDVNPLYFVDFSVDPNWNFGFSITTNTYDMVVTNVFTYIQEFVTTNLCNGEESLPLYSAAIANPLAYSSKLIFGQQFLDYIETNIVTYYFTNAVSNITVTNYPLLYYGWTNNYYTNMAFVIADPYMYFTSNFVAHGSFVDSDVFDYWDGLDLFDYLYNRWGYDENYLVYKDEFEGTVVVTDIICQTNQSFVVTNTIAYLRHLTNNTDAIIGTRAYHQEKQQHVVDYGKVLETKVERIPTLFIWDFKRK